jgi:DNA-binding transcriptional MerR regulator/glutaredoxin
MVGKSVAALRYYEQVGLLVPSLRTEAGYREYSPETVERVRFIVQAQMRGFSLREIKAVLKLSDTGSTPCASVAEAARRKVERLEKQIAQLHQRRAVLLDAVRLWESGSLAEDPFCPMLNLSELKDKEVMVVGRVVEVFTARCPLCDDAVKLVQSVACPSCEVKIYDLREGCATNECRDLAQRYGIKTVPAVVVDGKLADCCRAGGVDEASLRALGVGSA